MAGYVAYYRVSTARQGRSGLGLEAQQSAGRGYLDGGSCLLAERVEVESGKRDANRPKLQDALRLCRVHNATLVIAKLDRLSRDAHFLLGLQKAGVKFVAADMPEANEMVVGLLAVIAQAERKMISSRTKAALAAAKARGTKLGNPENLRNQEVGRMRGASEADHGRSAARCRSEAGHPGPAGRRCDLASADCVRAEWARDPDGAG